MKRTLVTLIAALLIAGPALASGGHPAARHVGHHAAAKSAPLVCPVTGDKIASKAKAAGHTTFKGKTYYFCCPMCKPKFDKNPAHYINNAAHGKFEKM